jgi:teichuronic acid biosynthesis glycosyltransferase TuaC
VPATKRALKVRLLFLSNLFPDADHPQRGLDNSVLLSHLAGGMEIRVCAPRPSLFRRRRLVAPAHLESFQPVYPPVPYIPKLGGLANHWLMERALRREMQHLCEGVRPDVVLASWMFPDGCAASRIARELGVPCVLVAQGTDVHTYLRSPLRRAAILAACERASAVITRSRDLGKRLVSAGAAEGKIRTVYNGVDTGLFRVREKAASRKRLGIPEDIPTALFVGNLLPVKNPEFLLDAFALAAKKLDGAAQLLIAGAGPLEAVLRAKLRDLPSLSTGAVHFLGRLAPEQVAEAMGAADVLCMTSRNEGLPNVILEAFASGRPVLATDVGGIHEVVHRPELGELMPEGDLEAYAGRLARWLAQPPDAQDIRREGEKFAWESCARAYRELLVEAQRGVVV